MALWQWSTTAAANATADPTINWQEGQAPSTINDSARAMMAAIAVQFQTGWEWQNMGDTPAYVSATQLTVPGNMTSRYTVGRRVRAFVTAGTIYGTITASAFTSLTTVNVLWDGSSALDSGVSEVDVSILNPANTSIGATTVGGALTVNGDVTVAYRGSGSYSDRLRLVGQGNYQPYLRSNGAASQLEFINSADTAATLTLTDGGNLTASGDITANSDERLKTDWEFLPSDFVERLAAVKSGTYARVDTIDGERHAGVSAQSLRDLLPEAVLESHEGTLSVAYGNAALVACVELAKEVLRLRALLEPVK
ncbi:tail fiber domain-containing protein [Paraburkholderia caribensis]|uniref:tail fiber domain-containing protein n=1 Tax=Paraburkholderia caribensis TaxID=75105 RepID=UPI0031D5610E